MFLSDSSMKEPLTLALHDPHAFLREEVMALWLEAEEDGPLLDKIEELTRRQALLVYHTIMMVRGSWSEIEEERIKDLIENPSEEAIVVGNTTIQ